MDSSGEQVEAAGPLDLLLTQAALGPARRFLPGRSGLRFAGALARRPDRLATRLGGLAGELARVAVGALGGGALDAGPAVRRPGVDAEPGPAQARAGLSRGRDDGRGTRGGRPARVEGRRAGEVRDVEPGGGGGAQQQPADQPGRVEGGDRHRRRQRGRRLPSSPGRPGLVPAGALDGRARRLPGGRGSRAHAGGRRPAHAGVRADPVPTADADGPHAARAGGAPDDQQVLHPRPRAGAQPRRVPGAAGDAGLRRVLAQPRRPPQHLGLRHLRAVHSLRPGRGGGHLRRRLARTSSPPAPAASSRAWRPRTWPPPGRSTGWPASTCSSPCSISPERV